MANQTRVKTNFISGTVTNNPLTNAATVLTGAALAALPAIDATQHAVLVLDPLGLQLGPEIVYVTAHTAASTGCVIVRGREGTSGVQHSNTASFYCGPVYSDWIVDCTSATRPSTGGLPYQGEFVYETDTDKVMRYNGTTWTPVASPDVAFTPTWTQSATVSKTVNEATYQQTSNRAMGNVKMTATSAGTLNNDILLGLPVAHAHAIDTVIGSFWYVDTGTANYAGAIVTGSASGGTTAKMIQDQGTSYIGGSAVPITVASGDVISYCFNYKTS